MANIIGQDLVKKVLELFAEELNRFAQEYLSTLYSMFSFMVRDRENRSCDSKNLLIFAWGSG